MASPLGSFIVLPREIRDEIYTHLIPNPGAIIYPSYQTTKVLILRARKRKNSLRRSARIRGWPSIPSEIFIPRHFSDGRIPDNPGGKRLKGRKHALALLYASRTFNAEFLEKLFKHTTFSFDINVCSPSTTALPEAALNRINNVLLTIDTRKYKTADAADFASSGLVRPPRDADKLVASAINRFTRAQRTRGMLHVQLQIFEETGTNGDLDKPIFLEALRQTTDFKTIIIELVPCFEGAPDNTPEALRRRRLLGRRLLFELGTRLEARLGSGGYSSDGTQGGTRDPRFVCAFYPGNPERKLWRLARLVEGDLLRRFEGLLML